MDPLYSFAADDIIVEVRYLTYKIVREWHNEVQPLIDQEKPKRPDSGWNWWVWFTLGYGYKTLGQKTKGYYVSINGIPVALAHFAFQYDCEKDETKIPNFLWLMSRNPVLDEIIKITEEVSGTTPRVPIGDIIFELIMEEAKTYNQSDMFWLHASSDGENPEELLEYYEFKDFFHCPLNRRTFRETDDGRYLYRPERSRGFIETVHAVY